jgi:peptidoglycan/LPS O-acetylase OafA/YrhL
MTLPGVSSSGVVRAPRLHFLDGLRGLASLYVLMFHEVTVKVLGHGELSRGAKFVQACFGRGHFSVVFFIVLSGYSIMLPIARTGTMQLAGGFRHYLTRRSRRILPPYYAALVLSWASIVGYNAFASPRGLGKPLEAALEPGSLVSHFLLVHNINFDWAYRINGPMWSVATEWQIYFIFPAVLLPLWRWWGGAPTVAFAWLVGSLPTFLLPYQANFFWACPWLVGSFALGMAGAVIGFSPAYDPAVSLKRLPWGSLTAVSFAVLVALVCTGRADAWAYPSVDLVVSVFAICWINACVQRGGGRTESDDPMLRILGSKALVYLGGFSYSLYLVQHPILRLMEKAFGRAPLSYDAILVAQLLVGTPMILAIAWLFSEFFERPFTTGAWLWPALTRRVGAAGALLLSARRPQRS